jgi:hypothetical protein
MAMRTVSKSEERASQIVRGTYVEMMLHTDWFCL